jgi:hypothetical protein
MTTLTKRPSGDDSVQLIPSVGSTNWNLVDEAIADDSDYLESDTTLYRYDKYTFVDDKVIPADATINFVKAYFRCDYVQILLTTTIRGYAKLWIGVNYYDSPYATLTTTWTTYDYTWAVSPATGVAWTKAEVDALKGGPLLYSGNILRRIPRNSHFYLEVDFTEAGGAPGKMIVQVM